MPDVTAPDSFAFAQRLLERTVESEKGIFYSCPIKQAYRVFFEIETVIRNLALESMSIYERGHKNFGRCIYDVFQINVVKEEDPRGSGIEIRKKRGKYEVPRVRQALIEALEAGETTIKFPSLSSARNFRSNVYKMRKALRAHYKDKNHPMYGRSIFDSITLRLDPHTLMMRIESEAIEIDETTILEL